MATFSLVPKTRSSVVPDAANVAGANVAGAILISSCSHWGVKSSLRRGRRREERDLREEGVRRPKNDRDVLMMVCSSIQVVIQKVNRPTAPTAHPSACSIFPRCVGLLLHPPVLARPKRTLADHGALYGHHRTPLGES